MVADADPIPAGDIEAHFDRMFSSAMNKTEVRVVFHPRQNAVSLEFRYEMVYYRQFWDLAGRLHFITALERYKEDYSARKLDSKYRKTRSIYGRVNGRVEWETFKFTKTREANPVIELGYRFRGEFPFFTTLMRSAKEIDTSGDSVVMDSRQINMYFTRAQADALAKLFDQEYLIGLLKPVNVNFEETPQDEENEIYREYGN